MADGRSRHRAGVVVHGPAAQEGLLHRGAGVARMKADVSFGLPVIVTAERLNG
ncbi:hypothetical protein ACFXJ5_39595 [Streptomyces sp. NPDC059373]